MENLETSLSGTKAALFRQTSKQNAPKGYNTAERTPYYTLSGIIEVSLSRLGSEGDNRITTHAMSKNPGTEKC